MKKLSIIVAFLACNASFAFAGPAGGIIGLILGPPATVLSCPARITYTIVSDGINGNMDKFTAPYNDVPVLTPTVYWIRAAIAIPLASSVAIFISPILGVDAMHRFEMARAEGRANYSDFLMAADVCRNF